MQIGWCPEAWFAKLAELLLQTTSSALSVAALKMDRGVGRIESAPPLRLCRYH